MIPSSLCQIAGTVLLAVILASCGGGGGGGSSPTAQPPENGGNAGIPSVTSTALELPSVHGLSTGSITVQAGASESHGNVMLSCPANGPACTVTVAADGTIAYAASGGTPTFTLIPPEEFPELPVWQPVHGAQAPIIDFDGTLHVGPDVAPPSGELATSGDYNGIAVSSGEVQDGVGADRVFEYLQEHMTLGEYKNTPGLEGYAEPPVVRIAEGTDEEFTEYVVRAVQLVNTALPYDKRVVLSTDPAPPLTAIEDVPDGQIFVDFAPWADWNDPNKPSADEATAIAQPDPIFYYNHAQVRWEIQGTRASHVWVDTNQILSAWVFDADTRQWEQRILDSHVDDTDTTVLWLSEEAITSIVAHELLHTLGFAQHVDPARFEDASIMNVEDEQQRIVHAYEGTIVTLNEHNRVPGHMLFPADREALLATYARLEPGLLPEDFSLGSLDPWDDTSFHLMGEMHFPGGDATFGVATRNGLAQPWASGPTPWSDLTDNTELQGSAIWAGALLGVTPSAETVAGNARLDVDLAELDGQLDFTNLEQWGIDVAPGAPGSGTMWGDGDLGYGVEIRGNTFIQTDGDDETDSDDQTGGDDDGVVTGAFFGATHEAMGGVLERDDLSASFGGTR